GPDAGAACTAVGSRQTTQECRPALANYQASVALALNPFTTGAVALTAASGVFCPSQPNAGAFGKTAARRIAEAGTTAGDLTDGAAHSMSLASAYCVPFTGNAAVDSVIDLPGPGALALA